MSLQLVFFFVHSFRFQGYVKWQKWYVFFYFSAHLVWENPRRTSASRYSSHETPPINNNKILINYNKNWSFVFALLTQQKKKKISMRRVNPFYHICAAREHSQWAIKRKMLALLRCARSQYKRRFCFEGRRRAIVLGKNYYCDECARLVRARLWVILTPSYT